MTGPHELSPEEEVEQAIRAHPSVRDAAVFRTEKGDTCAFVVARDEYLAATLSPDLAESAIIERWRKTYDLSQHTKEAAAAPPGFNIAGWNSSYTRKPVPAEEMREWVERSVSDILDLRPSAVYEIGCGTGLLLMRVAPRCRGYVAVDVAPSVLLRLRDQLRMVPDLLERVQILERRADNFAGLEADSFDTVLLSSVVQYFPSLTYLTKVLSEAIRIVKPGGHIYLGDIRSLPLLPTFASSVEFFQAADQATAAEVAERARRRVHRDPELVLSPFYFLTLPDRFKKISRVDIRPLRGYARNEMSLFRFQVILHIGCYHTPATPVEFLDWNEREWNLDKIHSRLKQFPDRAFGVRAIQNARTEKDVETASRIEHGNGTSTVLELRRGLEGWQEQGIDPQHLFDLESEDSQFSVFLSWAASRKDGSYDAAFIPRGTLDSGSCPTINWPQPHRSDSVYLASAPGRSKLRKDLCCTLADYLSEKLLRDQVPSEIAIVDCLPRAESGEVDGRSLFAATESSGWTQ